MFPLTATLENPAGVNHQEPAVPAIGLETLWDRMSGQLARYAGRLLGSLAAGEDAVQDVFSRYIERRPEFELLAQQEAWLWRSVRNAVLDILRSKGHRITESLDALRDPESEGLGFEPADGGPSPERIAGNRQQLRLVQETFETLGAEDREILWLSEVEGLEVKELASVYRRPAALVKVRLHRARKRLRAKLEEKGLDSHE